MRLFLSYRRGDSAGHSGRLGDTLTAILGERQVVEDVVAVSGGAEFETGAALDACDAVLAVIGPRWLTTGGADGSPRLSDPDDHVRRELGAALQRDIPVVPVLVGGATRPDADALPEELRPLLRRPAVTLHDASWQRDVDELVESLRAETAPPRQLSRRWLAVLAAIAAAVIALVAVVIVRQAASSSASSPGACPLPNDPGTSERSLLTDPTVSISDQKGGVTRFTVLDAYVRPTGPSHWFVQAQVRITNTGIEPSQQAYYRYDSLAVDDTSFPLACFNLVTGDQIVAPRLNSEAEIGFNVTEDPFGPLTLVLADGVQLPFADPGA